MGLRETAVLLHLIRQSIRFARRTICRTEEHQDTLRSYMTTKIDVPEGIEGLRSARMPCAPRRRGAVIAQTAEGRIFAPLPGCLGARVGVPVDDASSRNVEYHLC